MADPVTVAIPVRNAGPELEHVLRAVGEQKIDRDVELLVCDSGSDDGSAALAQAHGAEVLEISPSAFSHGGTRNLLVERARGSHVALLTQDAVPAGRGWLAGLLEGFELAPDVGLAFGPYRPRPDASAPVARELARWFASFGAEPVLDRLAEEERTARPVALLGRRTFFTDANGCIAKAAWREVGFRAVPYAEDHQLALDMLRAGYAKAYVPNSAVVHSHEYPPLAHVRRCFDEWRGLREVYGYVEPFSLEALRRNVVGPLRADLRAAGSGEVLPSIRHYGLRYLGAVLGSRADRMSPRVRARLSLEGRDTFIPANDQHAPTST